MATTPIKVEPASQLMKLLAAGEVAAYTVCLVPHRAETVIDCTFAVAVNQPTLQLHHVPVSANVFEPTVATPATSRNWH